MNKILLAVILVMLSAVSSTVHIFGIQVHENTTVVTVPDDFPTIQDALNYLHDNKITSNIVILVNGGTYNFVSVKGFTNLTIEAITPATIRISDSGDGFTIAESNNITVRGFTIEDETGQNIEMLTSDGIYIENCRIITPLDAQYVVNGVDDMHLYNVSISGKFYVMNAEVKNLTVEGQSLIDSTGTLSIVNVRGNGLLEISSTDDVYIEKAYGGLVFSIQSDYGGNIILRKLHIEPTLAEQYVIKIMSGVYPTISVRLEISDSIINMSSLAEHTNFLYLEDISNVELVIHNNTFIDSTDRRTYFYFKGNSDSKMNIVAYIFGNYFTRSYTVDGYYYNIDFKFPLVKYWVNGVYHNGRVGNVYLYTDDWYDVDNDGLSEYYNPNNYQWNPLWFNPVSNITILNRTHASITFYNGTSKTVDIANFTITVPTNITYNYNDMLYTMLFNSTTHYYFYTVDPFIISSISTLTATYDQDTYELTVKLDYPSPLYIKVPSGVYPKTVYSEFINGDVPFIFNKTSGMLIIPWDEHHIDKPNAGDVYHIQFAKYVSINISVSPTTAYQSEPVVITWDTNVSSGGKVELYVDGELYMTYTDLDGSTVFITNSTGVHEIYAKFVPTVDYYSPAESDHVSLTILPRQNVSISLTVDPKKVYAGKSTNIYWSVNATDGYVLLYINSTLYLNTTQLVSHYQFTPVNPGKYVIKLVYIPATYRYWSSSAIEYLTALVPHYYLNISVSLAHQYAGNNTIIVRLSTNYSSLNGFLLVYINGSLVLNKTVIGNGTLSLPIFLRHYGVYNITVSFNPIDPLLLHARYTAIVFVKSRPLIFSYRYNYSFVNTTHARILLNITVLDGVSKKPVNGLPLRIWLIKEWHGKEKKILLGEFSSTSGFVVVDKVVDPDYVVIETLSGIYENITIRLRVTPQADPAVLPMSEPYTLPILVMSVLLAGILVKRRE